MSDLVESVERILVEAYPEEYEPDSRVVTRDIINAVADKLEAREQLLTGRPAKFVASADWLRSQATPDRGESE